MLAATTHLLEAEDAGLADIAAELGDAFDALREFRDVGDTDLKEERSLLLRVVERYDWHYREYRTLPSLDVADAVDHAQITIGSELVGRCSENLGVQPERVRELLRLFGRLQEF